MSPALSSPQRVVEGALDRLVVLERIVDGQAAVMRGHHVEQLDVVGLVLAAEDVVEHEVGMVGQLGGLELVALASFDDNAKWN